MDKIDTQPPANIIRLDFFAELGPKSARDRAALRWRMPRQPEDQPAPQAPRG